MPKCEYGCGGEGNYQLKNGKWSCERLYQSCPGMKKKNSNSNKGQKGYWINKSRSEETKRKIAKSLKGKHLSKETRIKISKASKGHTVSKETKIKIGNAQKGEKNHR